jgi:hypothetical protein
MADLKAVKNPPKNGGKSTGSTARRVFVREIKPLWFYPS